MKSRFKSILWLALTLLITGHAIERTRADIPNPANDPVFARAREQETINPAQAMDTYVKIKNENARKNRELAAEALYRAAFFGYTILDPDRPSGKTPLERQRDEDIRFIVGDKAHEAIKNLLSEFPDTEAARTAEKIDLKAGLESRIDRRNSILPTYKIIDSLVALTGRNPHFSYWFALVLIAVLVTLLTWPLKLRMYQSQREMQRIQPILKDIQEKYRGRPELNEKIMQVYREHNVNPFASCLPMFIQLPFLWWVYNMIRLYEFHFVNGKFLWIGSALARQFPGYVAPSLGHFDYALLFIYAGSNYLTMKLTPPSDPAMAQQQKTMAIMMTGMMIYFFLIYRWTAAFMLYWLALNLLSAAQQYYYIYLPNKAAATASQGATSATPLAAHSAPSALPVPRENAVPGNGGSTPALSPASTSTTAGTQKRTPPRRKRKRT
ncbi:MAG: YidC/Oxa1 family membrane protein insertase [Chloroherpetonaceae bacterium]|nr:YidC/Oxa1 family membrane protein insertase [Chthonomonadaceae bacterium]MDW8208969.1 YidC/Oxa1 family membrane protein insertase [Chloroherpetonaceae bacterium]